MEHLEYSRTITGRMSCHVLYDFQIEFLKKLESLHKFHDNEYVAMDLATKNRFNNAELNKLKKKEREGLNPRTRKNSRWC